MTVEMMRQLPRIEKLKLLEALWEDLSCSESEIESPAWHETELQETDRRIVEGQEEILDWEAAKRNLRSKFP